MPLRHGAVALLDGLLFGAHGAVALRGGVLLRDQCPIAFAGGSVSGGGGEIPLVDRVALRPASARGLRGTHDDATGQHHKDRRHARHQCLVPVSEFPYLIADAGRPRFNRLVLQMAADIRREIGGRVVAPCLVLFQRLGHDGFDVATIRWVDRA